MALESGLISGPSSILHYHGECLSNNIWQLPQHWWVHPIGAPGFAGVTFPKWSLTWSCSTKEKSSLLQTFTLASMVWNSLELASAAKTEANKTFSNSTYSVSFITTAPTSFSSTPTFSLVFLLLLMYLKKPFLLSLTSLASFDSKWTFP